MFVMISSEWLDFTGTGVASCSILGSCSDGGTGEAGCTGEILCLTLGACSSSCIGEVCCTAVGLVCLVVLETLFQQMSCFNRSRKFFTKLHFSYN